VNKISVIACPIKSSSSIEPKIKLRLTPNKIISNANKTKIRLGLHISSNKAKNINKLDIIVIWIIRIN
jgi:hypothetical protein